MFCCGHGLAEIEEYIMSKDLVEYGRSELEMDIPNILCRSS
jgi:hypothetical protein